MQACVDGLSKMAESLKIIIKWKISKNYGNNIRKYCEYGQRIQRKL